MYVSLEDNYDFIYVQKEVVGIIRQCIYKSEL